jgi:nucleoid DNA-binding protein
VAKCVKFDISKQIAQTYNISKKEADRWINAVIGCIEENLCQGTSVTIKDFGSFRVRRRPARNYRNSQTGQMAITPACNQVVFKCSKMLVSRVQYNEDIASLLERKNNNVTQ